MKRLLPFLLFICAAHTQAQVVPSFTAQSSCNGTDSVMKAYKKDADRLTLRHTFDSTLTWKDSVKINKTISNKFMKALVAVFNATSLPVRDTVIKIYKIHAPQPEMNNFQVKAPSNLLWMGKLLANQLPTNDPFVDNLLNKYLIQPVNYYQSTNYDVAIFKTDTNYNLTKLCAVWAALNMVIGAEPLPNTDPTYNITGTLSANTVDLIYSYNYGTCEDGCDYSLKWHFKVNLASCVVEYKGWSGNQLSIAKGEENHIQVYPNPAQDSWHLSLKKAGTTQVEVYNLTGQLILSASFNGSTYTIDASRFAKGMYVVKLIDGQSVYQTRLIKQ
jgi:hypothetical protein